MSELHKAVMESMELRVVAHQEQTRGLILGRREDLCGGSGDNLLAPRPYLPGQGIHERRLTPTPHQRDGPGVSYYAETIQE